MRREEGHADLLTIEPSEILGPMPRHNIVLGKPASVRALTTARDSSPWQMTPEHTSALAMAAERTTLPMTMIEER